MPVPRVTAWHYAIKKIKSVNEFLMQQTDEKFSFEETVEMMENLFKD